MIYDQFLSVCKGYDKELHQLYKKYEVFDISNIVDHISDMLKEEIYFQELFPRGLRLPYPVTSLAYTKDGARVVHACHEVRRDDKNFNYFMSERINLFKDPTEPDFFMVITTFFFETKPEQLGQALTVIVGLTEDGSLVHQKDLMLRPEEMEVTPDQERVPDMIRTYVYYALTMINCVNVQKQTVSPCKKMNSRRTKQGKKPLIKYHVLKIPNRKTYIRTGTGTGTHKRLHTRRGHFKRRSTGIYWWHPHIVGHKEEGIMRKDYQVERN